MSVPLPTEVVVAEGEEDLELKQAKADALQVKYQAKKLLRRHCTDPGSIHADGEEPSIDLGESDLEDDDDDDATEKDDQSDSDPNEDLLSDLDQEGERETETGEEEGDCLGDLPHPKAFMHSPHRFDPDNQPHFHSNPRPGMVLRRHHTEPPPDMKMSHEFFHGEF